MNILVFIGGRKLKMDWPRLEVQNSIYFNDKQLLVHKMCVEN
jgi:hypothetical protein